MRSTSPLFPHRSSNCRLRVSHAIFIISPISCNAHPSCKRWPSPFTLIWWTIGRWSPCHWSDPWLCVSEVPPSRWRLSSRVSRISRDCGSEHRRSIWTGTNGNEWSMIISLSSKDFACWWNSKCGRTTIAWRQTSMICCWLFEATFGLKNVDGLFDAIGIHRIRTAGPLCTPCPMHSTHFASPINFTRNRLVSARTKIYGWLNRWVAWDMSLSKTPSLMISLVSVMCIDLIFNFSARAILPCRCPRSTISLRWTSVCIVSLASTCVNCFSITLLVSSRWKFTCWRDWKTDCSIYAADRFVDWICSIEYFIRWCTSLGKIATSWFDRHWDVNAKFSSFASNIVKACSIWLNTWLIFAGWSWNVNMRNRVLDHLPLRQRRRSNGSAVNYRRPTSSTKIRTMGSQSKCGSTEKRGKHWPARISRDRRNGTFSCYSVEQWSGKKTVSPTGFFRKVVFYSARRRTPRDWAVYRRPSCVDHEIRSFYYQADQCPRQWSQRRIIGIR